MNVCDLSGYVSPRLDPSGPVRKDGMICIEDLAGHGITPDIEVLGEPVLTLE